MAGTTGPMGTTGREERVEDSGECPGEGVGGLSPAQLEVLERCLHVLTHAKNDSHTLAALLLITRLCPAGQMDGATLRRLFEAVGLGLPARLLVTAVQGDASSGLPPGELLSLGTALLAALSTDSEMAVHPQLLSTVPLLLGLLADGPGWKPQNQGRVQKNWKAENGQPSEVPYQKRADTGQSQSAPHVDKLDPDMSRPRKPGQDQCMEGPGGPEQEEPQHPAARLDEAMALDCYQVLSAVCASPRGPELLLARGVVPALCQAVAQKQTLSHERGLPLLSRLLSGHIRPAAWSKHPVELSSLLADISAKFFQASNQDRLEMCTQLPQFLPPPGGIPNNEELRGIGSQLWDVLRLMVQAKITPSQLGSVLVVCACLLDLFGWEPVGPPKFCCLLVNRACVEVRMALEEPPGTDLSLVQQHILTACYRIMEAAMEQACSKSFVNDSAEPQSSMTGLSLQQSRQVLGVLEEAFSAIIYYLQQVNQSPHGDSFLFATFRLLCAWLAEETSCLKEEVTALLPFLIGYVKGHVEGERLDKGLADWMSKMSVTDSSLSGAWTGDDALRLLLPALCHLSAEESPRQVLLTLDTPALLVAFLGCGWCSLRSQGGKVGTRDPSMETACSTLLNFVVTEPDRVSKDPCIRSLQYLLSDALPILLHKPRLLVLATYFCTLGLMIGRLTPTPTGPVDAVQQRFFSAALRFLSGALSAGQGPARVSAVWEEWWEEVGELWRLGLQALGGCAQAQPWVTALAKEGGWLGETLSLLGSCTALPDSQTQGALEEALTALARQCPLCRQDISDHMVKNPRGPLHGMTRLRGVVKDGCQDHGREG